MKKKEFYSLGVMSGTSLDGLDLSLIRSDGEKKIKILYNTHFRFSFEFKKKINKLIKEFNKSNKKKIVETPFFKEINLNFSKLVKEKIKRFLEIHSFDINEIDLIGLHGNTLFHNPKKKKSFQLGDPLYLTNQLKKPLVFRFRDNDIDLGGEGAPLVPIYHQSLFAKKKKNLMVINIGGISNFTCLLGLNGVFASDIGPGNVLIDKFCQKQFKKFYDFNGVYASKGKIICKYIKLWEKKRFLKLRIPKSFDNYFFKIDNFVGSSKKSKFDIIRTLTFFTAKIIVQSKNLFKNEIDEWIFCGGGVKNITLMNDIKKLLKGFKVRLTDDFGYDSNFIESQAFAYISIRTLKKKKSTFTTTTGAKKDSISGEIFRPEV